MSEETREQIAQKLITEVNEIINETKAFVALRFLSGRTVHDSAYAGAYVILVKDFLETINPSTASAMIEDMRRVLDDYEKKHSGVEIPVK